MVLNTIGTENYGTENYLPSSLFIDMQNSLFVCLFFIFLFYLFIYFLKQFVFDEKESSGKK